MEIGTRQTERWPQEHQHTVFIGTIGGMRAIVRGAAAIWKVGNMGVPQLKRMLSYLVAHVEHAIHRDDIAAIGSRRSQPLARATNLSSAIKRLIQTWHMGPALRDRDGYLTLMRHTSWISDTDLIEHHAAAAALHLSTGDADAALDALQQAAAYCGGIYLPDYDVPDYSLREDQYHWLYYQRDILHRLARLHLTRNAAQEALPVAQKTARLGDSEAADDLLLADIYAALGNARLADYYTHKARRRRD
ncbi:hypothetical protein K2Z83_27565 [Oscillochloris sp. ZM17-4]|uniref:hypothetical protein n=1 Tax=Oscillochloris sp. ZM17-4 TaxID=2866714 RepID=UPI001C735F52|nr:hypothetical protein [Oscillochloris sp. ZM17-4]MBX0331415.1 hypothetical protein [Oscillochloris sp. ZM17-4]